MRILIACEFSGRVREAFRKRGHDAWSCDLLPTDQPGNHLQCDVREVLNDGWDMMIAHPPCTYLCTTANRWNKHRWPQVKDAIGFARVLWNAPIPKICLENPVSILSTYIRKPNQIIQPYWFGYAVSKATCLWLKGLKKLKPTKMVEPIKSYVHSSAAGRHRSVTFICVASAFANQRG